MKKKVFRQELKYASKEILDQIFSKYLPVVAVFLTFFAINPNAMGQSGTFCNRTYDVSASNKKVSDFFPNSGTWTPGTVIYVSGRFTIDRSITLSGLVFLMDDGAIISVAGTGVVATANGGTRFIGCEKMWRSIEVVAGAAVNFSSVNIFDSLYGLHFLSSANASACILRSVLFKDNWTAITVMGFPASRPFAPSVFSDIQIRRDGNLAKIKEFPTGFSSLGNRARHGILLLSATANLASGASLQNLIEGYRYGIFMRNSALTVSNCRIASSTNDLTTSDPNDGTDIFSDNSTLVAAGCIFQGPDNTSIYSIKTRLLDVVACNFFNPYSYGVRCEQSDLNSLLWVQGNTFEMGSGKFIAAIYVDRPPGGLAGNPGVRIMANDITVPVYNTHQKIVPKVIVNVEGNRPSPDRAEIRTNRIRINSVMDRVNGIRVAGRGNNYNITESNLLEYLPEPSPGKINISLGIIAENLLGINHDISGNTVRSKLNAANSFVHAGIRLQNIPLFTEVCLNNVENTHKGFECMDGLNTTYIQENTIGNAAFGLFCNAANSMPDQIRHLNLWTGSYNNQGAQHGSASHKYRYFVDNADPVTADLPPSWTPLSFFELQPGPPRPCGFYSGVPSLTAGDRGIISGTTAEDTTASNWDERRELLYRLMTFNNLANDPAIRAYLNAQANSNTSAWQFARAAWLFEQSYANANSPVINALNTELATYQMQVDSLNLLHNLQAADSTSYDWAIAQLYGEVFGRMSITTDNIRTLTNQVAPAVAQGLQAAASFIQTLPTNKLYEQTLKDILDMTVRSAKGDSLNPVDTVLLHQIAARCPVYAGKSVAYASLLLPFEQGKEYVGKDYNTNCSVLPALKPLGTNQVRKQDIRISPNPVQDQFFVNLSTPANAWQIADLSGKIVATGTWPSGENTLSVNTATWIPGMYLFRAFNDQGQSFTAKFAVVR